MATQHSPTFSPQKTGGSRLPSSTTREAYRLWGAYLHVPFCRFACHYCDFAKTAHFDASLTQDYFAALKAHAELWLKGLSQRQVRFDSLYFGGGTPGLFGEEYGPILELFQPHLKTGVGAVSGNDTDTDTGPSAQGTAAPEITIEANPGEWDLNRLRTWRSLGFNRISLGVQSLQPEGLKRLTRQHSPKQAHTAITDALKVFSQVNVDLIYGWPGHTLQQWQDDLKTVIDLGVQHLSLYHLTFEPRTPLGRQQARGRLDTLLPDETLSAGFYAMACERLKEAGYRHHEVSNWSLPTASCSHNWHYWRGDPYLALGNGAHGFLPQTDFAELTKLFGSDTALSWPELEQLWQQPAEASLAETSLAETSSRKEPFDFADRPFGVRYAYPRNERLFAGRLETDSLNHPLNQVLFDGPRKLEDWLLETLGTALRTTAGISKQILHERLPGYGYCFQPSETLLAGLKGGLIRVDDQAYTLKESEWFREHSWALEFFSSIQPSREH